MSNLRYCFVLILFGCEKTDPWRIEKMNCDKPKGQMTRVVIPTKDPVNGLDLEFFHTDQETRCFINIHTFETTPYENDPTLTLVTLTIDDRELLFLAERREGGQRLFLEKKATLTLLSALRQNKSIHLSLDGYEATIYPSKSSLTLLQKIAYHEEKSRF